MARPKTSTIWLHSSVPREPFNALGHKQLPTSAPLLLTFLMPRRWDKQLIVWEGGLSASFFLGFTERNN